MIGSNMRTRKRLQIGKYLDDHTIYQKKLRYDSPKIFIDHQEAYKKIALIYQAPERYEENMGFISYCIYINGCYYCRNVELCPGYDSQLETVKRIAHKEVDEMYENLEMENKKKFL